MERVDIEGLSIAYERAGQGPPLLLLHGLPGDSRAWRPQLESLADTFTVIAWDAPGCGRSDAPAGDFGTADVVRSLVAFVRVLGLERPHVLGLSWGGGLALELYRQAPEVPRTLILASAYAGWAGSLRPDALAQRLAAYERAAAAPGKDALRAWGPALFSRSARPEVVEETLSIMSEYDPRALLCLARSFAETDLRDTLSKVRVPTLLLYGDADTRSPMYVAEALQAAMPESKLVVLEGVGHVSNLEAPDRFDAAIREFVRSLPR